MKKSEQPKKKIISGHDTQSTIALKIIKNLPKGSFLKTFDPETER